jgi:DNA-binding MarR family transcriptional regulator
MSKSLGFRVEAALVALLNRRTRMSLYGPVTSGLAGQGVDSTSYPVLSAIERFGPISAAALAPLVGLERTVTSRYAARLETAGLVGKVVDPSDHRVALLELTDKGTNLVAVLRQRLAAELESRLADWPPSLASAFVEGLERFVGEQRGV